MSRERALACEFLIFCRRIFRATPGIPTRLAHWAIPTRLAHWAESISRSVVAVRAAVSRDALEGFHDEAYEPTYRFLICRFHGSQCGHKGARWGIGGVAGACVLLAGVRCVCCGGSRKK